MTLSLLSRELDRSGRDLRVYWLRTMVPIFALAMFVIGAIASLRTGISTGFAFNAQSIRYFMDNAVQTLLLLQYLFVIFGVPWLLAGTFSTERREGTLDLLILADFSGWNLIAAKVGGALAPALAVVAAAAPIQMSAITFGAINPAVLIFHWQVLAAFIVCQSGIGLWASLCSISPREAFLRATASTTLLAVAALAIMYVSRFFFVLSPRYFPGLPCAIITAIGVMYFVRTGMRLARTADGLDDEGGLATPTTARYESYGEVPPGKVLLSLVAGYPAPVESSRRHFFLAIILLALQLVPMAGWLIALCIVASGMIVFVRDARRDGILADIVLIPGVDTLSKVLARSMRIWILVGASAGVGFLFTTSIVVLATTADVGLDWSNVPFEFFVVLAVPVPFLQLYCARCFALHASTRDENVGAQIARVTGMLTLLCLLGALPSLTTLGVINLDGWGYFRDLIDFKTFSLVSYLILLSYGPWNIVLTLFAAAWVKRLTTDEALMFGPSSGGPPRTGGIDDRPTPMESNRPEASTLDPLSCTNLFHSTH